ncbi:MAG: SDR family NAD(P)-dependent oxidoreductase [Clostridia bacterium]|nr:SDR family NAD(P)-dependent oxidoreductase [Clostridia bacterium]
MDKVVIVTGAGSGIGLATAKHLLNKGCKVYGVSLHEHDNLPFPCYTCDVTDTAQMNGIFNEIKAKEGRIDALVNNAGYGISGAVELCNEERVKHFFDVDLCSVVNLSAAVIPHLREAGGGKIINIGSVASLIPITFRGC